MSEVDESVCLSVDDVRERNRVSIMLSGTRVVVFAFKDSFVAYVDVCSHQGGPVCSEGTLHPFLTAQIEPDGRVTDIFAPGGDVVLACPWHGWEYWIETGRCIADPTKSLRPAKVEVDNNRLIVSL